MIVFVRRYFRWVLALVFVNCLTWIAFELGHSTELSERDLWPLRMYLASGLLLFDNLCVLWWYAHLTREQKEAAHGQLQLASKDYLERNKPVVYSDRWDDPERPGAHHYVVRNVGGGFALNVYYIPRGGFPVTLGALAAGAERKLPAALHKDLVDATGGSSHILIAEGPFSRTTQWTATLNYRTPDEDDRHGQVEHANAVPSMPPPRGEHQTLADFLDNNSHSLFQQLDQVRAQEDVALERLRENLRKRRAQKDRINDRPARVRELADGADPET